MSECSGTELKSVFPPLPNTFILCSSSKQARFDDYDFYSVLGDDGTQWLNIYFEQLPKAVVIWIIFNKNHYKVGNLENPKVNFWYHVCLYIDLEKNRITASLNGRIVGTVLGKNVTNSPKTLHMVLGKSNSIEEQFQGSATNIQVFTVSPDHNISSLSSEPCGVQGDLLAWHPEDWRVEGERWLLVEETGDSVCDQGNNYTIAIPVEMGIHEAMDICRMMLNNSIMPYQKDKPSLYAFSSWYHNITDKQCAYIWVPLTDEECDGVFLDMNDDSKTELLFWEHLQPNGGTDQDYVTISPPSGLYDDNVAQLPGVCSSCLLDRSLLLRMDGVCEDSDIGD